MRLQEKIQYKLRNFLYEQDRKKSYKNTSVPEEHPKATVGKFKDALDEMDAYLNDKMKELPLPKIKKNE